MGNLGPWEIALIALIVLLIFGPKRLPGIGRSFGKGMREFKDSVGGQAKELREVLDEPIQLRDAMNPKKAIEDSFKLEDEEEQEGEVIEGEIVEGEAVAAEPRRKPVAEEEPAAASRAAAESPAPPEQDA